MANLFIHPATQKMLSVFIADPAHALCLTGDVGAGLGTIAHDLARQLSGSESTITTILPEKGVIPIERIRALYEQTRSIQQGRRVIVIDDADAMGSAAQNALLKLLEEPVRNVHFILTTHTSNLLLATIRSRVQMFGVLPLDTVTSKQLISTYSLDTTEQAQTLFLATGKPAELIRLASNKEYFAAKTAIVSDARTLLQADAYGRLSIVKRYTDRQQALELLSMCSALLTFTLLRQKNVGSADKMPVLDEVMKRITANGHVRTQLMYLVTQW